MTSKNLRLLFVLVIVCAFCYGNAQRIRNLGDLALAMDIIDHEYVEKTDRQKLYQAAMRGMIDSLDPYSSYIPVESLKPFQAVFEQEFGGLGVSLDGPDRRERLTVVSTLFDSPAYRAGIKPGDVILKINGENTATSSVEDVSKKLRGREGTQVTLTIEREHESSPLEITVTRGKIDVESVLGDHRRMNGKWDFMLEDDPRIAYMRIEVFGEKTTDELRNAIESVRKDCKALIIDLRDNTGGLLNAATDICDMFLNDGEMLSTRGRDNRIDQTYDAHAGTEIDDSVPMVILINEHSASASEVVAACLQDRHRAIVVGQRSYGKGSVQNVIPLDAGMAAMRLTTAYYFPPSGRLIHRRPKATPEDIWGVNPDEGCEIKLDEDAFLKTIERFRKRADPMDQRTAPTNDGDLRSESERQDQSMQLPGHRDPTITDDPQLLRAIEVLQEKLK